MACPKASVKETRFHTCGAGSKANTNVVIYIYHQFNNSYDIIQLAFLVTLALLLIKADRLW